MPDFEFRRVQPQDVAFCWSIYRDAMQPLTIELMQWNEANQRRGIEEALGDEGASILVAGDADAGWLHVIETRRDIHLGHLYLAPQQRNRGLGTEFLRWMGERATRKAGVTSAVGYNYRWAPMVLEAKRLIDDGALGSITNYRGRFFSTYGADPLGVLSWRYLVDEGGYGVSSDLLSHAVDVGLFLAGPITSVVGTGATFITARPVPVPR